MQRVTLKTSTIFIAKGDRTRVYHSVDEIPRGLRKKLEESTNGFNSATILIADRRGREEVRRALQGLPSGLRTRLAPSMNQSEAAAPPASHRALARFLKTDSWKYALGASVALGLLWYSLLR